MKLITFLFISQVCLISCDLFDDAKNQLESLDAAIKASVLETEESFVSTVDLVQESLKTFHKIKLGNLDNIIDAMQTRLDAIEQTADNSTVDVSGCFANLNVLPSFYKIASDSIETCINNGIQSCINLLTDSIYLVNIAYNQVQAIRYQLNSCSANQQECAQSVLDEIASSLVSLPELITVSIENFQDTLVVLQKSSKICANSSVETYNLSTNTTISATSQCIDNAIGH